MNNYKVYKHTSPSGKVYIGITGKSPEERWFNGNGYSKQKLFYKAIQKYGWDNFKHEILFENLTKEEACQKEIELIAEYKSNNSEFGYNQSLGGEIGSNGYVFTLEDKAKMSQKAKGENNGFYGKHHTFITKQKISEASKNRDYSYLIGRALSDETRKKISQTQTGRVLSEETKKKISEGNKGIKNGFYGKHHTDETKLKNSLAHLGKKFSVETKDKLSENSKNRKWINNGIQNKFIKIEDLDIYLANGFILGMLPKGKEQK